MGLQIKCKKTQMKSAARAAIELAIYLIFRTISAFAVVVCLKETQAEAGHGHGHGHKDLLRIETSVKRPQRATRGEGRRWLGGWLSATGCEVSGK